MPETVASVIVCTHNPRPDYLRRVIDALAAQTLSTLRWELLLVDNASADPLCGRCDVSWHPNARHIRESDLGLTPARLRGISEARGKLLVFVDDDNVLAADYLERALGIAGAWPLLGAWGGTIVGEFETRPQPWAEPLLAFLGIRKFDIAVWSNNPDDWHAQPCGAGLCVRASVASEYRRQVDTQPWRRRLDRIGHSLSSCGDSDLVQTSCDLGLGFGNFPELVLTHLIPARRLEPDYILRLMQGMAASGALLRYYRTGEAPQDQGRLRTLVLYCMRLLTQDRNTALLYKARQMGVANAARFARELPLAGPKTPKAS